MKLAIRDDDTCAFSDPAVLEEVYGDIWDEVPVTLACVPYVSADSDVAVDIGIDSGSRSIAENSELVAFLRRQLEEDRIELALHGYHHDTPGGEPEFVGGRDLGRKVREGRQLLEQTFDTDVTAFVPPHVRLSNAGLRAVFREGLDIVRGRGPRPREIQPRFRWLWTYSKLLSFYLRHERQYRYPHPLHFGTHREMYCHRINRRVNVKATKSSFDFIQKRDGVFCLSAHAYGLNPVGRERLETIVNYALENGAKPVKPSDLSRRGQ